MTEHEGVKSFTLLRIRSESPNQHTSWLMLSSLSFNHGWQICFILMPAWLNQEPSLGSPRLIIRINGMPNTFETCSGSGFEEHRWGSVIKYACRYANIMWVLLICPNLALQYACCNAWTTQNKAAHNFPDGAEYFSQMAKIGLDYYSLNSPLIANYFSVPMMSSSSTLHVVKW